MKRNKYFLLFLSLISLWGGVKGENIKNLHREMHKSQLANAKSAIDKSVIQDFILNEIVQKEEQNNNTLSNESLQMIEDLLTEARTHIGKRYRSGGKGPSSFDCSGFSSYVFSQFGYKLGASSGDQFQQGEKVEKNQLRPGDLVFFTGRNSKGRVGHVGIVVEADNERSTFKFIHAATSGGIRIDSNVGYYAGRYLGAKRIITE